MPWNGIPYYVSHLDPTKLTVDRGLLAEGRQLMAATMLDAMPKEYFIFNCHALYESWFAAVKSKSSKKCLLDFPELLPFVEKQKVLSVECYNKMVENANVSILKHPRH